MLFNICGFGLFNVSNIFADFYVGGEITENTTWYLNQSPYIVVSNVIVRGAGSGQTATLIIQPGVQVKFLPNTGLFVGMPSDYRGALIAQGTQTQPIIFTSNLTSPSPGSWNSVYFRPQTNNPLTNLEYCNFVYGGNSTLYNATLYFESSSPTIRNSRIANSGGYGVFSDNNSGPTLTGNLYSNNALYPISTNPNGIMNITQSTGSGNNPNAIEVRGGEVTTDVTWTPQAFPYELSSNVTICDYNQTDTAILTIQPDTRIQFRPQTGIFVGKAPYYKGAIIAQGIQTQPITFTSYNTTSPQPGDWNSIYFRDQTNDTLTNFDYCNFEYGGNNSNAILYFESASPHISNSTISNSGGYGIFSDNNSGPTLTANSYSNNALYPISSSANGIMNITESTGIGNNPNAIQIRGGEVNSDIIWTQRGFPYEVASNVTICDYNQTQTATLTINPGTQVRFRPDSGMYIGKSPYYRGALIAQGNQSQPITFTSYNTANPLPGDWDSLYFTQQANSNLTSLDFCTLEYGGDYYNTTLYFKDAVPRISRSTISNSSGYGIYSNTTNSKTAIHNSNIISNSWGGIFNTNTTSTNTTVQAQYNWWGDASGPSGAGPGTGQWISENVEYEPWLGESFSLQFYLYNISVSPQEFSQNGGWTTFSIDISEQANWTITIEDNQQQLVRTFQGTGTQIRQDWYGDDENQIPLDNGIYTYSVTAESIPHPGTTASLVGGQIIILNNTLPTAKITSPEFYQFLANNGLSQQFQIIGTASGANFSSYTLEYGSGEYPTQWTEITTSTTPVTNGLLGTWDAVGLTGSIYTIRLTVTNTVPATASDLVTVNLLSVYNLYDSVDPFSPNNDGFKDDTTIGAEFSHSSDWLLNITSSRQTVRTFTGTSSSSLSQAWDGRDNSQQVLADGNYTYQVQITEPTSGLTALSQTGTSYIDNTQPTTLITSPTEGQHISGLLDITGTANDINFEYYKVEYGQGENVTQWYLLNQSYTPVVSGTLATWDVLDYENGPYTLKLTASDIVGNIAEFFRGVFVDNIDITNVTVSPHSFNPSNGETTNINYTLNRNANVLIAIQDLFYNIIDLIGPNPRTTGPNTDIWDGYNQTGNITADGAYTYTINATDGESFGEYTPSYIPSSVGVSGFTLNGFDPYNNQLCNITYSLDDYAQVQIKAGGTGGNDPNWSIVNWLPRVFGPNVDYWNGRDPDNNVVDLSQATLAIWTQRLPDEPIIVVSDLTVDVSTNPYSIIPSYGEFTTITYTISNAANVTVTVLDTQGTIVKTLEDNVAKNAGTYELTWDGTDSNNQLVLEGNFTIKVVATGGDGKTTIAFANVTVY